MPCLAERRFYRFGRFCLDPTGRVLLCGDRTIPLPPKAAAALLLLVQNAGDVVEKQDLLEHVWQDAFVEEGSLTRTISILRKALEGGAGGRELISTIAKRGYRFVGRVEVEGSPALRALSLPSRIMLAVLPFENMSSDKEQEYFSEGLTEEMITQLGRMNPERLGVIARTSAMRYKNCGKAIQQIGRELGVPYVLEGSVRRAGHRVRVTAQLIQVADETHLWASTYDRDLGDVLALQNDVACAIADEIRIKLTPQERARLGSARAVNPQAYEACLKGRYLWNMRTRAALHKAAVYFEKAVAMDPTYAAGYAGLADSYLTLFDYNYLPPGEASTRANAAARRALEIDETLAEPHTSMGHLSMHQFDWAAAEREFQRAIELNPSYGAAHYYYANWLAAVGRLAEAIAEAERAFELDPVAPSVSLNASFIYYMAHQYERAIQQAERTLEMDPSVTAGHYHAGLAYEQQGLYDKAIAALQKAASPRGRGSVAALAHAYGAAGKRGAALKLLKKIKELSVRKFVSPFDFAMVFAGLGENDEAFAWLFKAQEERCSGLLFLKVDPRLAVLRSDPRFGELARLMNFPA